MQIELPYANPKKGTARSPLLADDGSLLVSQSKPIWSRYAERRRLFHGNIAAAGVVLPIFSNTAQKCGLWNPQGSGVKAILKSFRGTYVSTTGAAGGFVLGVNKGIVGLATGGISAFTEDVVENGQISTAKAGNECKFTGTAGTTVAPTLYRALGMNQLVLTGADATNPQWRFFEDFDGDVEVMPGNAVWVAGNIATLVQMAGTLTWAEEDL